MLKISVFNFKRTNYTISTLIAQLVKNLPAIQEALVRLLGWDNLLEKGQATHSSILGLPCSSAGKESACSTGDLGSTRSPGEKKGYPLQYSGLENSMDSIVHGVTKSWTRLSHFHFQYSCPDNSIDRGVLRATGHGVAKNRT